MRTPYSPSLDGLRALAIFAVIAFHARAPFALGGGRGVDLFFVLSGFLITGILASGSVDVAAFWKRRAMRLVPAFVAMVLGTFAISPLLISQYSSTALRDGLLALTYTMNLAQSVEPWDNPFLHTWSLAVEAQFYVLWPYVVPHLVRNRPAVLLLATWLAALVAQVALAKFTPLNSYYFPHFSGLILGSAIVFLPTANRWLGLVGAAAVLLAFTIPAVPTLALEVGAALMISSFRQDSALRSLFAWRPLARVGLISYGVYLWHFPIHCVFEATPWFVRGSFALFGGLVLGELSYRYVETRFIARAQPASA